MSNIRAYIDYFRKLATWHQGIQHNPYSETGDAPVETKHFCKWNAEEVISGLRTAVSFSPAALLIELYDTNLKADNAYDIKQRPKGAFTVLCKAEPKSMADEERAFTLAETITYDILRKLWDDHHGHGQCLCETPFYRFWFDRLEIIPVGPLWENCYGFRCEFEFEFQQAFRITEAPADGTFVKPWTDES